MSFLPGVVLGLRALFPTTNIGLELAAILMIFTGQAWNMTFSLYHSLRSVPPDLQEVRQALERVVKDGYRAGAVLGRIRGIVKKAPSRMEGVDINEAVREVIDEYPDNIRVAIVGSGGLWHTPGRPGAWLNVDFDQKTLDLLIDETEEFITGTRSGPESDRLLVTVMFTDIVSSTERAAAIGDRRWRELLDGYVGVARRQLERFRGREVDVAGDGLFAIFDGPARAIRCACAIRDAVPQLGLEVRAGLHTGECEVAGSKVSGIAVHTGARIAAAARPQEVLASGTVRDLVAGSGIRFDDRGSHVLKGVPGDWRLFAVAST